MVGDCEFFACDAFHHDMRVNWTYKKKTPSRARTKSKNQPKEAAKFIETQYDQSYDASDIPRTSLAQTRSTATRSARLSPIASCSLCAIMTSSSLLRSSESDMSVVGCNTCRASWTASQLICGTTLTCDTYHNSFQQCRLFWACTCAFVCYQTCTTGIDQTFPDRLLPDPH